MTEVAQQYRFVLDLVECTRAYCGILTTAGTDLLGSVEYAAGGK